MCSTPIRPLIQRASWPARNISHPPDPRHGAQAAAATEARADRAQKIEAAFEAMGVRARIARGILAEIEAPATHADAGLSASLCIGL
jgi:hypothetical protein